MGWTLDHVQLAMPAGQEDRARSFYVGVLGMVEVQKPSGLAGRGGCWFRLDAVELHLGVETSFAPARKAHPGLAVTDLDALRETLEAAGHETTPDDVTIPGRRRFHVSDPFGNRLEFLQDSPDPTTRRAT